MAREHLILSALEATPIPVPRLYGLGEQDGAAFYVAEFVDGVVLRDQDDALLLAPAERKAASLSLVRVLGELHSLSPDDVALGQLGPHHGYVQRQLRRWHTQWTNRQVPGTSAIDRVHSKLITRIPNQTKTSIVHGDFKLANMILASGGDIRAVLDWELCTLGDPLADLGLLLAYWPNPGQPAVLPTESAPTHLDGFLSRENLISQYEETSGLDASNLSYYIALAYWKLAIIIDGVFARHATGAYGAAAHEMEVHDFPERVRALAEASETLLD